MDLDRQAIEEALAQISAPELYYDEDDESSDYYDDDESSDSSSSSYWDDEESSSSGYYDEDESSDSSSYGVPEPRIITLKAIVIPGDKTKEGELIEAVGVAWFEVIIDLRRSSDTNNDLGARAIAQQWPGKTGTLGQRFAMAQAPGLITTFAKVSRLIQADPDSIYEIGCWKWEEIIAGAYKQAGWDAVILTPRSGDRGRDVIATRNDVGAIRFVDQVKAYGPHRPVPANDVRALFGVLALDQNATKGVITTTSTFAPGIEDEFKHVIPYRLELKPKEKLVAWLSSLMPHSQAGGA